MAQKVMTFRITPDLEQEIRKAAGEGRGAVSAWLIEAVRHKLDGCNTGQLEEAAPAVVQGLYDNRVEEMLVLCDVCKTRTVKLYDDGSYGVCGSCGRTLYVDF